MKAAALVLVVFSTYFVYSVSSECCDLPSFISYHTKPGYECSAVEGGRVLNNAQAKCVVPICANGKLPNGGRCTTGTCEPLTCVCKGECIPTNNEAAVENFKKFNGDVLQSAEILLGN